jgi:hypothetical protein
VLTEPQLQRYARQLLLPEIGGAGQERLLAARVDVHGEGPAADLLRTYLAAAGVSVGPGGIRVASRNDAAGASWVLDDVGVAWGSREARPCGGCLAAALAELPRPPEDLRAAVGQAAGALAASQLLLWLVGQAPNSAGVYVAWPKAERRTPIARNGCGCGRA